MTDFLGAVVTGLASGLGLGFANYFHEKHIRTKLEHIDGVIDKIKYVVKGDEVKN